MASKSFTAKKKRESPEEVKEEELEIEESVEHEKTES